MFKSVKFLFLALTFVSAGAFAQEEMLDPQEVDETPQILGLGTRIQYLDLRIGDGEMKLQCFDVQLSPGAKSPQAKPQEVEVGKQLQAQLQMQLIGELKKAGIAKQMPMAVRDQLCATMVRELGDYKLGRSVIEENAAIVYAAVGAQTIAAEGDPNNIGTFGKCLVGLLSYERLKLIDSICADKKAQ